MRRADSPFWCCPTILFGEEIENMIDTIIELLIYAIFPFYKKKKRREEEWHGVLEQKIVKGDYSLGKYKLYLLFRTDADQKIKIPVREELFSRYEEGKRYYKKKGEELPERES